MKRFPLVRIAALFFLLDVAWSIDRPAQTTPQFVNQLQNYETKINEARSAAEKIPALRDSIPDTIEVQTSRGKLEVETKFLRDGLSQSLTEKPATRAKILSDLSGRLHQMQTEAELYGHPDPVDDAMRARLDRILSSPEFNRVKGPSALELLKQRIAAWMLKQMRKLNPKIPGLADTGYIFVWIVIGLASAVAGVWLYRLSRQNLISSKREILPFLPSSRSWNEWLRQARDEAARGDWRNAIHFGFWAAVSRLEDEGTWPPNKTRTPREYLRAIPESSSAKQPFSSLTRTFEASWYGARPTTESDFAQFTTHLERLGCR
jgi:hypothetical protein